MATFSQRSFSGGELTPSLYARVDFSKYQSGLRTCRNYYVMRHGGVTSRSGSMFVAEVKDSTTTVRMIPFVFNNDQTYILEFGDEYMRVHKQGVQQTEAAKTITNITAADPAVVTTSASHGYSNGEEVYISGVVGMTEVNNRNFKVANVTGTTFELQTMDSVDLDASGYTAYSSGGSSYLVYEISTPYAEEDLMELNFVQSADVITIVHPNYAPRELSRSGDINWSLSTISFGPSLANPTISSVTGGLGGTTTGYSVSAVTEDGEEGGASSPVSHNLLASVANPVTVTWGAVTGAQEYNVYKQYNDLYYYIGTSGGTTFLDEGTDPDTTKRPVAGRSNFFDASSRYPSAVTYYQQRLLFANTDTEPETVWASKSGFFKNFNYEKPIADDSSIDWSMTGQQVNEIRHLLGLGKLIILTGSGEWIVNGDQAGILTPTSINQTQFAYNGANTLRPIIVNNNALYVQSRGSIVRDLSVEFQSEIYKGNDLTIYSSHLFDDYTISDWTYQQVPHSIVWCARSDGTLLGLTYLKDQEMLAWHRHDFSGGTVENVCAVPEGNQDVLYVVVKRTIDGRTTRYIERVSERNPVDDKNYKLMDSHLTYDGRNTSATTMTLSGGTNWTYDETVTITASTSYFSSSDVGNEIHLTGSDGSIIRFELTAYTSGTVMSGRPNKTIPLSLRSTATSTWTKAVDEISGLWHLEGEDVSIYADEFVVASPNNASYDTVTVSNGSVTLDKPYGVIHIGLPITADFETLNIDSIQGETISDKKMISQKMNLFVEETRGLWAGPKPPSDDDTDPLERLTEYKLRRDESYDAPVSKKTEVISVNISAEWSDNGRVFVRQVDPVPSTILAAYPSGLYPFRGG